MDWFISLYSLALDLNDCSWARKWKEKNQMLDIRGMAKYMLLSSVNRSYDVMSRTSLDNYST